MRSRALLPVLIFLAVAIVFGVALYQVQFAGKDPRALPSALIDRPAPQFSLPPPPGFEAGLETADLTGAITLVNVFASWCAPCRIEHPHLMDLAREPGIRIVGLNYKDDPAKMRAWLEEDGNPYVRIGFDDKGEVGPEWGITGVPETFILDREGRIRFRWTGPITPDILKREIMPVIDALRGTG